MNEDAKLGTQWGCDAKCIKRCQAQGWQAYFGGCMEQCSDSCPPPFRTREWVSAMLKETPVTILQ
jgi:hypothetical protein